MAFEPDETNPIIPIPYTEMECRIEILSNEKFRGGLFKEGELFGEPSGLLTREGLYAWLRLVTGNYADTYEKGE